MDVTGAFNLMDFEAESSIADLRANRAHGAIHTAGMCSVAGTPYVIQLITRVRVSSEGPHGDLRGRYAGPAHTVKSNMAKSDGLAPEQVPRASFGSGAAVRLRGGPRHQGRHASAGENDPYNANSN